MADAWNGAFGDAFGASFGAVVGQDWDAWGGSFGVAWGQSFGPTSETPSASLRAGRPRRGRRPIWNLDDGKRKIDAQALREAKAYLASLAAERALTDLMAEQRILQDSLEIATARQRKQIAGLISTVERRIVEIEEEEVSIILLT